MLFLRHRQEQYPLWISQISLYKVYEVGDLNYHLLQKYERNYHMVKKKDTEISFFCARFLSNIGTSSTVFINL